MKDKPERPFRFAEIAFFPGSIVKTSTEAITISLALVPEEPKHTPDKLTGGNEMANAVAYLRISKEEEGSMSLATQETAIRKWCEANGHEILEVFTDEGVSGGTSPVKRPGASQAIKAARARNVEILIVSKLDRMSRDLKTILDLVDNVLRGRATLISVSESFDASTPGGRMFLQMLGSFAEFERGKIRERTRDALATLRSQGKKTGGHCPYGYTVKAGKLVPKKREQAVLDHALALKADGASYAKIAETLNAQGHATRQGRPWSKQRLYETLKSEERRRKDREASK